MPYQPPPTLRLRAVQVALELQDARPQVLELIPVPDGVELVIADGKILQHVVYGFRLSVRFEGTLEAFSAPAGAAKEEPVRPVDLFC